MRKDASAFIASEPHTFADGSDGVSLTTKGWMPYLLHWNVRELSSDPPGSLVIEVSGDFEGRGIWTLMPDGDHTSITYDWRIRVEKPGVKKLGEFKLMKEDPVGVERDAETIKQRYAQIFKV